MGAVVDMVPDMRSVKETAARFGLPVHFIRQAVADGRIYAVQAGSKKYYVNQASVIAYLNGESATRGQQA